MWRLPAQFPLLAAARFLQFLVARPEARALLDDPDWCTRAFDAVEALVARYRARGWRGPPQPSGRVPAELEALHEAGSAGS